MCVCSHMRNKYLLKFPPWRKVFGFVDYDQQLSAWIKISYFENNYLKIVVNHC